MRPKYILTLFEKKDHHTQQFQAISFKQQSKSQPSDSDVISAVDLKIENIKKSRIDVIHAGQYMKATKTERFTLRCDDKNHDIVSGD